MARESQAILGATPLCGSPFLLGQCSERGWGYGGWGVGVGRWGGEADATSAKIRGLVISMVSMRGVDVSWTMLLSCPLYSPVSSSSESTGVTGQSQGLRVSTGISGSQVCQCEPQPQKGWGLSPLETMYRLPSVTSVVSLLTVWF